MKLVTHNQKYVLFSDSQTTTLLYNDTFLKVAQLPLPTKIGYLQFGTGIAALVNSSKVRIYGTHTTTDRFLVQQRRLLMGILSKDMQGVSHEKSACDSLQRKNFDSRPQDSYKQVLHSDAAGRTGFSEQRLLLPKDGLLYLDPPHHLEIILAQQKHTHRRSHLQSRCLLS